MNQVFCILPVGRIHPREDRLAGPGPTKSSLGWDETAGLVSYWIPRTKLMAAKMKMFLAPLIMQVLSVVAWTGVPHSQNQLSRRTMQPAAGLFSRNAEECIVSAEDAVELEDCKAAMEEEMECVVSAENVRLARCGTPRAHEPTPLPVSQAAELEECRTDIFTLMSYSTRQRRAQERRATAAAAAGELFVRASTTEECVVESENAAELADCLGEPAIEVAAEAATESSPMDMPTEDMPTEAFFGGGESGSIRQTQTAEDGKAGIISGARRVVGWPVRLLRRLF